LPQNPLLLSLAPPLSARTRAISQLIVFKGIIAVISMVGQVAYGFAEVKW